MIVAALLALSFFCKQTGILLVLAGAGALAVLNWRALPGYLLSAGAIGGGGSVLLDLKSGGWFWIYVFEYHQQHDTNADRFWRSFGHIFLKFPVMTATIVVALGCLAFLRLRRRALPPSTGTFLYWTWMFVCGTLIGAIGWATQWAHFNAYLPAMAFGACAAGAAIVVVAQIANAPHAPHQGATARLPRARR